MTIEQQLAAIGATLQAVADAQLRSQATAQGIATATEALIQAQTRTQETIADMATSIGKYVEAADARMKRLEENLDGLIRAITAEHSNGKTKH